MFCDACGAQITGTQRFCGTCGKPLGMVVAGRVSSRVADHRQLLGILWTVYAMLHILIAGVIFVLANTFFRHFAQMPQQPNAPPLTFLTPLMSFISIAILGKGLLALVGGVGLMQKQHWARMITLVSAFLGVLSVPVGTALGIYTMWVLMSANAEEEYAKLAASTA